MVNNEWRSIIDPQKYVVQQTFWAKHKRTLGNESFVMMLYLCFALTFTTIFILTHIVYPDAYGHGEGNPYLQELMSGWDYVLPLVVMLCIYSVTPKWEDHFYIHKEMRYISYALCIMYCSYYANLLLLSMLYPVENQQWEDMAFFVMNQCIQGAQFVAMMISTVWTM